MISSHDNKVPTYALIPAKTERGERESKEKPIARGV